MQTVKNEKISGAALNITAVAVICFLIWIGAIHPSRRSASGPANGGNLNSALQSDSTNPDTNTDHHPKHITFVRPEVQMTNGLITVAISTDTPIAQGEHVSTILEMPNGAVRTHKSSVVTNGTRTSFVLSWQFDSKRDGLFLAAAQDALAQSSTRLQTPQTLYPSGLFPVFTVTDTDGGIVRGSIEYHVLSPHPLASRQRQTTSFKTASNDRQF